MQHTQHCSLNSNCMNSISYTTYCWNGNLIRSWSENSLSRNEWTSSSFSGPPIFSNNIPVLGTLTHTSMAKFIQQENCTVQTTDNRPSSQARNTTISIIWKLCKVNPGQYANKSAINSHTNIWHLCQVFNITNNTKQLYNWCSERNWVSALSQF